MNPAKFAQKIKDWHTVWDSARKGQQLGFKIRREVKGHVEDFTDILGELGEVAALLVDENKVTESTADWANDYTVEKCARADVLIQAHSITTAAKVQADAITAAAKQTAIKAEQKLLEAERILLAAKDLYTATQRDITDARVEVLDAIVNTQTDLGAAEAKGQDLHRANADLQAQNERLKAEYNALVERIAEADKCRHLLQKETFAHLELKEQLKTGVANVQARISEEYRKLKEYREQSFHSLSTGMHKLRDEYKRQVEEYLLRATKMIQAFATKHNLDMEVALGALEFGEPPSSDGLFDDFEVPEPPPAAEEVDPAHTKKRKQSEAAAPKRSRRAL